MSKEICPIYWMPVNVDFILCPSVNLFTKSCIIMWNSMHVFILSLNNIYFYFVISTVIKIEQKEKRLLCCPVILNKELPGPGCHIWDNLNYSEKLLQVVA